ncbi:hypothetical protein H0H81_007236 [Sphagnurus paluster]|uniref:Uncharacterized protein n=1 Tax=Sphagnurus paluster TaxID=117069 RepID=A0A9P7K512_9AGAR|nr:hypothetical protein H0H81_007236 [Sphagnurus paluster]
MFILLCAAFAVGGTALALAVIVLRTTVVLSDAGRESVVPPGEASAAFEAPVVTVIVTIKGVGVEGVGVGLALVDGAEAVWEDAGPDDVVPCVEDVEDEVLELEPVKNVKPTCP